VTSSVEELRRLAKSTPRIVGGAAETALPQTFVMTFADLATQQPLGPLGHFDPVTGVGSVIVPNLAPGNYPVVATCVQPTLDLDMLEAGIRKNGAFLQSIGAPADINSPEFQQFLEDFPGANGDLFTFLNLIGPSLIQNIVTPGALGVQFFTVLAQPMTKDDCKKGGWKQFSGLGFKNQGSCIKFVNTHEAPGSPSGAFLEDAAKPLD